MKGLEALGIDLIDSIDWFQDFTDAIISEQAIDGGWPISCFDRWERILSTEWALLTLQKAIPPTEEGPDLVISEKYEEWINEPQGTYRVFYTIKNQGNAVALAGHAVNLTIDGVAVDQQSVSQDLMPAETYSGSFDNITLSDGADEITVCADINDVVIELNENNNCRINPLPSHILTVEKTGTGRGDVRGPGIDCGLDCSEEYLIGKVVTLTAHPFSGSEFFGWSGACSGMHECVVKMDADKVVTATFHEGDVVISKDQDFIDRGNNTVYHGDTISYRITVENLFESVMNLMISDALSAYVKYLGGTLEANISGSPALIDDSFIDGVPFEYDLALNEILTIAFNVQVLDDVPLGSIIENTATVYYLDTEKRDFVQVRVGEIPEPATVIFIGIGLIGIFIFASRTFKRRK